MTVSPSPERRAPERPARYQRSFSGLVAAMVVLVGVVAVVAVLQWSTTPKDTNPTPAIDYKPLLGAARADGRLLSPAPASLPRGWRATSETYVRTSPPSWHLGLFGPGDAYLGIDESSGSETDYVQTVVGDGATENGSITLTGALAGRWHTWAEPGGDFALSRRTDRGTIVVITSTQSQSAAARFADTLTIR